MNKPVFNKLNFDESFLSLNVVDVTSNTIKLSWESHVDAVEYRLVSVGETSVIYQGPNTTFTHRSRSNTEYTYSVTGISADGKRTKPASVVGKTVVRGTPVAPTKLWVVDKTPDSVVLGWDRGIVDGGKVSYRVRRGGDTLNIITFDEFDGFDGFDRYYRFADAPPLEGSHVYCVCTVDDEFIESESICVKVYFDDITAPPEFSN